MVPGEGGGRPRLRDAASALLLPDLSACLHAAGKRGRRGGRSLQHLLQGASQHPLVPVPAHPVHLSLASPDRQQPGGGRRAGSAGGWYAVPGCPGCGRRGLVPGVPAGGRPVVHNAPASREDAGRGVRVAIGQRGETGVGVPLAPRGQRRAGRRALAAHDRRSPELPPPDGVVPPAAAAAYSSSLR